jgi:hypothetical protein
MMGFNDAPPHRDETTDPTGVQFFEGIGLKPSNRWPDPRRPHSTEEAQPPKKRFCLHDTLD